MLLRPLVTDHRRRPILKYRFLAVAIAVFTLSACAERVTIPDNDTTGPDIEVQVIKGGEVIQRITEDGNPESIQILGDRNVSILATATDAGGAQSLDLEAVSGGRLRDGFGNSERVLQERGDRNDPRAQLTIGTTPDFAEPTSTLVLTARASDFSGNAEDTESLRIELLQPVSTVLRAIPDNLIQGESTELSWRVSGNNADTARIVDDQGRVVVPDALSRSSRDIQPDRTTTYTLEVSTILDQGGNVDDTVTVRVPEPMVELQASSNSVQAGTTVTFSYTAEGVEEVFIDGLMSSPSSTLSGRISRQLLEDVSYTAEGLIGDDPKATDTVSVQVQIPATERLRRRSNDYRNNPSARVCPSTTSQIEIETADVSEPYGDYTVVEKLEFAINETKDTVNIARIQNGNVNFLDTIGANAGETDTTDAFNGTDVRGVWCLQYLSDFHDSYDPMSVTFTVSQP